MVWVDILRVVTVVGGDEVEGRWGEVWQVRVRGQGQRSRTEVKHKKYSPVGWVDRLRVVTEVGGDEGTWDVVQQVRVRGQGQRSGSEVRGQRSEVRVRGQGQRSRSEVKHKKYSPVVWVDRLREVTEVVCDEVEGRWGEVWQGDPGTLPH